ncbi:hypothetical protein M9H77_22105 [Catharanthus roseus]|uniref:Uncharacterized protein n=1 Tax=Catharanthus roseus TaxID=4058 RepID=A0ACC0AQR1_CATRO|nr:hypothetical protein M9H77_22105 [Catharanthus roseus]
MDPFEESVQENISFEGDEDSNTFENFLDLEEYIDLGHLFITDRIFIDDEEEEIPKKKCGPYGTKKCGCPFKLKGEQMATSENWQLFPHNSRHNHKIAVYSHGHAQSARLTEEQLQ